MSVVACPKCLEKVTLPPKAPPAAKVRCPLCGENYELAEALANAPPVLEIVELPEGYTDSETALPSLASSSFSAALDRSVPADEEIGDFRLQDDHATTTLDESAEPHFDEWGSTRSTAPAYEASETPVRRDPLPIRRKKKGANPLFHVAGIVLGGALAFPAAFLILLWLPGTLRRDPVQIGPWLGENIPFLVPADLRANASSSAENTVADAPAPAAPPKAKRAQPASQGGLNAPGGLNPGNRVENGLKNNNDGSEAVADPVVSDGPLPDATAIDDPFVVPDEPLQDPLLGGPDSNSPDSNTPEPALPTADPFAPESTEPEPVTPESSIPEPTLEPTPATAPESPATEPTTESVPEPMPATEPMPAVEPTTTDDPLAPSRTALTEADQAFDRAASPAEKKAAALGMYRAAAELAAALPAEGTSADAFSTLVNDPMKLQVMGVASSSWIDNANRGSDGVVLSGTVKSSTAAGEKFEIRVTLPSRDNRELVVIAPAAATEGSRVFVAGRIVQNAQDMIGGYVGEAKQAVDARVVQTVGQ
jgi:hypothetical protein